MKSIMIPLNLPSRFWTVVRDLLGYSAGLFPSEWGNEIVPSKRIARIDGFDQEAAKTVQKILSAAFGHNEMLPPMPDLGESVADYVIEAALWLQSQHVGLDEAAETLRPMLNSSLS